MKLTKALICAIVVGSALVALHQTQIPSSRYAINERTESGALAPANASVYKAMRSGEDPDGVVCLVSEDGRRYYHPFNVATEALADNGTEGTAGLYLEQIIQNNLVPTSRQLSAIKWLVDNKRELPSGGLTWSYPLPLYYSTFTLQPGWPSAFSQARIIHALIYAARTLGKSEYLKLALSAAKAYSTPVNDGGLLDAVDGLPFYEEVPVPDEHSPHILNGHLYSVVALYDLANESGDTSVKSLATQGEKSIKNIAGYYDAGYWTKYDLVPRVTNMTFLVRGIGGPVKVETATISSTTGDKRPLTLVSVAGVDSIFSANLPGPVFINNARTSPYYKVNLKYTGDLHGIAIAGMRPEVNEYYKLKRDSDTVSGSGTFSLPSQYVSDSSLSRLYQRWHSRLMKRIGEITGDAWYADVAGRWMAYDVRLDTAQKSGNAPTLQEAEFNNPTAH
jgi:hypothetical protein